MEAATSRFVSIPQWQDLCSNLYDKKQGSDFVTSIKDITQKDGSWQYRTARHLISNFMPSPCYQKLLKFHWSEIIELIADQTCRNKAIVNNDNQEFRSTLMPVTGKLDARVFRPHSQLPCTQGTAVQRVQKALDLFDHNAKILLLGDDDMVSVELAQAGFKHVTAVDIDKKVIRTIEQLSDQGGHDIRLAVHDLRNPAPNHLIDDYDLVFFDPEYTPAGLELFVSAALNFTRGRPGTKFFVSLHLMSLMPSGIAEAESFLNSVGFDLLEFHQGFNIYPVPARMRALIHIVNQFVIGSKTLGVEGWSFPYFLSDALLLQKI